MNVSEAITTRRTIRAFKPEPVPENVIREVLEIAREAPSNSNTQPWRIDIASGATRDALQAGFLREIKAGVKPHPAFPPGGSGLKDRYKERQRECAFQYFGAVGIEKEDMAARRNLSLKNYEFFGAPNVAFLSYPETMHRANAIDMGIFLQTIMLLLVERGIASCPQGALATYPDVVKALLPVPTGNAILCGLSFGYPDMDAQINSQAAKMGREPIEMFASFTS
ncbi:MAG: nitroreductase [Pseudomonadota bacterium]